MIEMDIFSQWQRILVPIYTFILWPRLKHKHRYSGRYTRNTIVYVKSFRTVVIDILGAGRQTTTFLFPWEGEK